MRNKLWMSAGLVAGMVLGFAMSAQAQTPAGAVPTGKTPGEASSDIGKQAHFNTLQEFQHGGINFMGTVKVQDAPLPWDPIPVVVTCNGVVRYRTIADAKGRFTIQGSQTASELVPTKKSMTQVTASQLVGCDAEADVPGFTSSKVYIMNGTIMDNPDIGTITLRPDVEATGSSSSPTTAAASPEAMKKFDKARSEWMSGNSSGAEHDLQKAAKTDPKFAEAWYQLGKLQQPKDPQAALASYQKAVAADPKFVSPYQYIAEIDGTQKKWQDMDNATSAALKLDPKGTPQLWYFDAVGKLNTGDADGAEVSARKSLAMDPQHLAPNTEQLLAVILAGKGQLAEALHHLENSLTYIKTGPNVEIIKQQIAQLEKALPPSPAK